MMRREACVRVCAGVVVVQEPVEVGTEGTRRSSDSYQVVDGRSGSRTDQTGHLSEHCLNFEVERLSPVGPEAEA